MDVRKLCLDARAASLALQALDNTQKNAMLNVIADALNGARVAILQANAEDLANYDKKDTTFRDRLTLNDQRIDTMIEGVRQVTELADPVGEVVEAWTNADGLCFQKVRAPLGVIGVIYEARPNVTVDVAALTIKSGNAVILRGGKEAIRTNRMLFQTMQSALENAGMIAGAIQFIDDIQRESTLALLKEGDLVDVIIPRGGDTLKKTVLENATMPVIASAGGNCHIYVHQSADLKMAEAIVLNAKLQRPSVCNAAEQLLVDEQIAASFLPEVVKKLVEGGCEIRGCAVTQTLTGCKAASEQDYKTEFHEKIMAVKVVNGSEEAIGRINANNTKHSDAIVAKDADVINAFCKEVDSGCIYVNASTRFTDGFVFGFGAEIGISTQKLHARGPLGIRQLTSEKYICTGEGHIRK